MGYFKIAFLFLSIAFTNSCFAWKVIHKTDELKIWKKIPNVYVCEKISEEKSNVFKNPGSIDSSIADTKKRAFLSSVGINHWTVLKKSWDKKTRVLEISGYYLDKSRKMNKFLEYHHYKKETSLQLLLVSIDLDIDLDKVLDEFKKFKGYE